MLSDIEVSGENIRIVAYDLTEFFKTPHVELALDSFAVRVLSGIKGAIRISHFTSDEVEGFFGNAFVESVTGSAMCVDVHAGQKRIVVKHFFKVRNEPVIVRRVSMKPAADLIVEAAESHFI